MLRDDDIGRFSDVVPSRVNVDHATIYANIRRNIRRQLPQLMVHSPSKQRVALLCGGPSLADATIPRGYKIATVNGAYNWATKRRRKVSAQIIMDARKFNSRFVEPQRLECKYLICSQCDPSVFDAVRCFETYIWHGAAKPEAKILDRYYDKRWFPMRGGGSVGTRAIWVLYTMGIRSIRVYGYDSCLSKSGAHHAYAQSENDNESVHTVRVGKRKFKCHGWMINQADETWKMFPAFPDDLDLSFEGDGLVQYAINQAGRKGRWPTMRVED